MVVHPANIQDRDGLPKVMTKWLRQRFPFIKTVFADAGYQGDTTKAALRKTGTWQLEIIKRPKNAEGFVLLPKRWIVERTLAWISNKRRLAKDFERLFRNAEAMVRLAMIRIMLRRLFAE